MIETRRDFLTTIGSLCAGAFAGRVIPWQQQPDRTAAFRAQLAAVPIQTQALTENLTLLSGTGGNVLVLHGADGLLVERFFSMPRTVNFGHAASGLA